MARRLVEAGARYISTSAAGTGAAIISTVVAQTFPCSTMLVSSSRTSTNAVWTRCNRSLLGRVWTHPENQCQGWTRPLAQGNFCLLAGGGLRTGQVIGSTDKHAYLRRLNSMVHTLYFPLGVSPNHDRIFDLRGRPQYPIPHEVKPLKELV